MVHLFYLHSEITYLVSKCIIEHKGIEKKDVVFLLQRNFQPSDNEIQSFSNPFDTSPQSIKSHVNIFKSLKTRRSFNRYLKEITRGQYFYAYVPGTHINSIQLIINHKKCKAFSIFEEGTWSYINYHHFSNVYRGKKVPKFDRLGYLGQIKNYKFIDDRYEYIYGIDEHSFPGYERRVILDDLFHNLQYSVKDEYDYLNNASIIVLDGLSQYNEISQGVHVFMVLKILRYIQHHNIDNIYYKFHPAQLNTEEEKLFNRIFDEFSYGNSIKRMDDDVSLEKVIMAKQNLQFFMCMSSVGLYAIKYGHRVLSTMKIAEELDDKLKGNVKYYPDFFKEELEYIE